MENTTMENQGQIIDVKVAKTAEMKKFLLYATITCLSISALIGIFIILANPRDLMVYRVIGTTTIFGVLSLITMNNLLRLESNSGAVRKMSIAAIISNACWAIILLCLVWGVFDFMHERCHSADGYVTYSDSYGACIKSYIDFMKIIVKVLSITITTSVSLFIVTNFLSFRRYVNSIKVLSAIGIVCTAIITFRSVVTTLSEKYDLLLEADAAWRFYAILFIILVFCFVTAAVLSKVQGNKEKEKELQDSVQKAKVNEDELRARLEKEIRAEIAEEQKNGEIKQDSDENSQIS